MYQRNTESIRKASTMRNRSQGHSARICPNKSWEILLFSRQTQCNNSRLYWIRILKRDSWIKIYLLLLSKIKMQRIWRRRKVAPRPQCRIRHLKMRILCILCLKPRIKNLIHHTHWVHQLVHWKISEDSIQFLLHQKQLVRLPIHLLAMDPMRAISPK